MHLQVLKPAEPATDTGPIALCRQKLSSKRADFRAASPSVKALQKPPIAGRMRAKRTLRLGRQLVRDAHFFDVGSVHCVSELEARSRARVCHHLFALQTARFGPSSRRNGTSETPEIACLPPKKVGNRWRAAFFS
jgi:hypothetical protein